MNHVKLALGALVVGLVLLSATSASATLALFAEPSNIRAIWARLNFVSSAGTVTCPVTFEGSIHSSTFAPVEGLAIGDITRASIGGASCTGGRATLLTETLPWSVRYERLVGTLPEITGARIKISGAAIRAEVGGLACLAQSSETHPVKGTMEVASESVEVTGLRLEEGATIPLRGGFLCEAAGEGHLSGTAEVTERGGAPGLEIAVLGAEAPLTFNPAAPITIERNRTEQDVTIEATAASRTGRRLRMVGFRAAEFEVSEGCDERPLGGAGRDRCMVTVSFTGATRVRAAFLWVPVNGLSRMVQVIAEP